MDELDAHHFWVFSPVNPSDPTVSTAELLGQQLPNGTWRIAAHAYDSADGSQINSTGYVDVVIGGNPYLTLKHHCLHATAHCCRVDHKVNHPVSPLFTATTNARPRAPLVASSTS